jgi:hypothetical protein
MSLVGGAAVTSYWSGGAVGNQAAPSGKSKIPFAL